MEASSWQLPQVEVIGSQAPQGIVEHLHRPHLAAAEMVAADLRHQERLVAPAREQLAQEFLGPALMIVPAVVEEVHAGGKGGIDDLGRLLVDRQAQGCVRPDKDWRR